MAKGKRRTRPAHTEEDPIRSSTKDATLRVDTFEDVADSGDEFHIGRDKVALDNISKINERRRRHGDVSDDEQEVMGLEKYGYQEPSDSDDDDEEAYDTAEEAGEGEEDLDDEEVLGKKKNEDEEGLEGWGSSKKNYYGGHESDLEADPEEEEKEALRLQSTHLAGLDAEDFQFDDEDWATGETAAATAGDAATAPTKFVEELPATIPEDPVERLKLLYRAHPEFKPLTEEFLSLQDQFPALEVAARAAVDKERDPVVQKWKVASAYLGVLSLYFAVMAGEGREQIREHPVMDALVRVRKRWEGVKDMRVEWREERIIPAEPVAESTKPAKNSNKKRKAIESASSDAESDISSPSSPAAPTAPKPKKRKAAAAASDFSDLATLMSRPSKPSSGPKQLPLLSAFANPTTSTTKNSDFAEPTALTAAESALKQNRRKSLRFHTSQIVSRTNKRSLAATGQSGDLDVPHRERRKERELRLRAETERRRNEGADLGDDDGAEEFEPKTGGKGKKEEETMDAQEAEYMALLSGGAKAKKEAKKMEYKRATEKELVGPDGEISGKRAIGYKIEKNKGLTPFRKKEVRNPRVKKRNAYEKKKIKLSSVKAVYKGGLKGSYGGEATGVKTNVVKSVKF